MATERSREQYPVIDGAKEAGIVFINGQKVIDDCVGFASRNSAIQEIYVRFGEGALYVGLAVQGTDDEWDRIYDYEAESVQKFPDLPMVFGEADTGFYGKDELEAMLPEGSILVYPLPVQSQTQ